MQVLVKIVLSLAIILIATAIAKKWPSTAGLIGVMPLTGALVLIWVYLEHRGDQEIMLGFTKGALWGILPSILFFLVALVCIKKEFPLSLILVTSFGSWFLAACVHQWIMK